MKKYFRQGFFQKMMIALALLLIVDASHAQSNTRKIVIVTFDGYRWKEAFGGADSSLFFSALKGSKDSAKLVAAYWDSDPGLRRKKLMPFLWSTFVSKGQLYGNRDRGSFVNVKNRYWFSYPGYNEIFTGYPDTLINSNDFPPNPNTTVHEFINAQPGFHNSIAVFTSWEAFTRILNKQRSGLKINAGYTAFEDPSLTEGQKMLNRTQFLLPKVFGNNERPDAVTYFMAKEYMQSSHPRVLQISFIETDAYAHRDQYLSYLESAHNNDAMLADVWNYIQQDPFYKDQTTLFIATDHGRGESADWTHHNSKTPGSDQVWFAAMGPYTPALGEAKSGQVFQYQYAKTMAALLGLDYSSRYPIGAVIPTVVK